MSHCNGKCSIPSIEIGQVWGYCRDNLRGTTPLAQAQIECLQRDYLAPSKAHIKRLTRRRPLVLLKRPAPPPSPVGDPDYRGHNRAHSLGQQSKLRNLRAAYGDPDILRKPKPLAPIAFDYTKNATVPKDSAVYDRAYYEAESERLARLTAQAIEEARRV
jgi:hypothetical protein